MENGAKSRLERKPDVYFQSVQQRGSLIDLNEDGTVAADSEKYYDMEGHMCEDGANEFSRILGEYLSK